MRPVQASVVKSSRTINELPAKDVSFESPRSNSKWTDEEDKRLLKAVSESSLAVTKPWKKTALFVNTSESKHCFYRCKPFYSGSTFSGRKHRSRLGLSRVPDKSTCVLGDLDEPNALGEFAECFLDDVEKLSSSKKHPRKVKRNGSSKHKRRIDFDDINMPSTSVGLGDIGLQDLVETIQRPAKRFSILVVDNVRTTTTKKKMSCTIRAILCDPVIEKEKYALVNKRLMYT